MAAVPRVFDGDDFAALVDLAGVDFVPPLDLAGVDLVPSLDLAGADVANAGVPLGRRPFNCRNTSAPAPTAISTGHSTSPATPSAPRATAAAGVE
ncbi:MAG: hypothetical protein JOZ23_19050 [Mycobacterium sp.]|nr:hypothetical protein [Mycobacterium sp.]MBV9353601.1 hypothetical protein [Mycobacterium sp.]